MGPDEVFELGDVVVGPQRGNTTPSVGSPLAQPQFLPVLAATAYHHLLGGLAKLRILAVLDDLPPEVLAMLLT